MSFHGALGNMAAADAALASRLLQAVASFDPSLTIVTSSSRAIETAAAENKLRAAITFLADRAYDDEGLLVPRRMSGSVIHDEAQVLERVRRVLGEGHVITASGKRLTMRPRSILLHGDNPGAVKLGHSIRLAIEATGARVVPISRHKV